MRKKRLARLAGLNTNNAAASSSNTTTASISPSTPGPSKAFTGSIMSPSIQQQLQRAEIPMEVEESSEKQCNTFGVDVDSGIENMEVEESDRKDSIPRSRVSCLYDARKIKTLLMRSKCFFFFFFSAFLMMISFFIRFHFYVADNEF